MTKEEEELFDMEQKLDIPCKNRFYNKEEKKNPMAFVIKGGKKFWANYLKKLEKAKKEGKVSCGGTCCK